MKYHTLVFSVILSFHQLAFAQLSCSKFMRGLETTAISKTLTKNGIPKFLVDFFQNDKEFIIGSLIDVRSPHFDVDDSREFNQKLLLSLKKRNIEQAGTELSMAGFPKFDTATNKLFGKIVAYLEFQPFADFEPLLILAFAWQDFMSETAKITTQPLKGISDDILRTVKGQNPQPGIFSSDDLSDVDRLLQ